MPSFDLDTADAGVVDPLAGLELERTTRSNGMPAVSLNSLGGFNSPPRGSGVPLYLDIETIPDYERMHLFGLPPLPEVPPETTSANCPTPTTLLEVGLDQLERELMALNPDDAFLELLVQEERKKPKPRAGVETTCKKVRGRKYEVAGAAEAQRKLLSTTPEYCRIVAFGWAVGNERPFTLIEKFNGINERGLIGDIWRLIQQHSPIVGYNILGFDLQVIRARSAILGIEPSRMLNDSPWNNNDVADLMAIRFGRSGKAMRLKELAKLYGIAVPAGDANGSDVEHLLANDPEKLSRYVMSDVHITRELHKRWQGYFCI